MNAGKGVTSDKRVRQAITLALQLGNYDKAFPLSYLPNSIISPESLAAHRRRLTPTTSEKAKQLLASAGVNAGTQLTLITVNQHQWLGLAQLVEQDLTSLGFKTTIRVLDTSGEIKALSTTTAQSDWQLSVLGSGDPYPDAEGLLFRYFSSANEPPAGQNWTHFTIPSRFPFSAASQSSES